MNLKFSLTNLRRRTLMLVVVVALSAAMLPTAAFASGHGRQGRAWDPGPRQQQRHHQRPQQRPNTRCEETYRVRRGDTLSAIAKRAGVSVNALARANGIRNPNRIFVGQIICIPC